MDEIKLYTLEEVSEMLRVKLRTIYSYIKEDKLKAIRMGKYWLVSHEDLQEFINSRRK